MTLDGTAANEVDTTGNDERSALTAIKNYKSNLIVALFNTVNNLLNSNSSKDSLNRLTTAFTSLFNSRAITALANIMVIVGNSFAVYIALGMGIERTIGRKRRKKGEDVVNLPDQLQTSIDDLNDKVTLITEFMQQAACRYFSERSTKEGNKRQIIPIDCLNNQVDQLAIEKKVYYSHNPNTINLLAPHMVGLGQPVLAQHSNKKYESFSAMIRRL